MMRSIGPTSSVKKVSSSMSPHLWHRLRVTCCVFSVFTLVVVWSSSITWSETYRMSDSSSVCQCALSSTFIVYSPDLQKFLKIHDKESHQVSDSSIVWSQSYRISDCSYTRQHASSAIFIVSESLFPIRKYEVWSRSITQKRMRREYVWWFYYITIKKWESQGKKMSKDIFLLRPK